MTHGCQHLKLVIVRRSTFIPCRGLHRGDESIARGSRTITKTAFWIHIDTVIDNGNRMSIDCYIDEIYAAAWQSTLRRAIITGIHFDHIAMFDDI